MNTIAPPYDPSVYLTTPHGPNLGAAIWQKLVDCGILIGGIDGVIRALTGFSPLEEWVEKPFAGDWDAIDQGTQAWEHAGKAVYAVGQNLVELPGLVSYEQWAGNARDAWATATLKVAQQYEPLAEACASMAEFCQTMADFAHEIINYIYETLQWVAGMVALIVAEQAVPVVGQVAAVPEIALLGIRIAKTTQTVAKAFKTFTTIVKMVDGLIDMVDNVISLTSSMAATLDSASSASAQAQRLLVSEG